MPPSWATRFWSKVEKTDTCWLWTGAKLPAGYGRFWTGTRTDYAHRFIYETYRGRIPDGLTVHHVCSTPACVNPDHLVIVTRGDNTRRNRKIQAQLARTACPRGHAYSPVNTYEHRGHRYCRACNRASHARRKETSHARPDR